MELGEPEIIFVRSDQVSPPTQAHLDTGEVSRTLEWFREVLLVVAKDGIITVKELKNVVKGNKDFAENLFWLFDTDQSDSITLQELIGGLSRLTVKGKKKKILQWFEKTFAIVSGEDNLLQLDEFENALQINGFVERLFQLMDNGNAGKLTIPEVLDCLGKLTCTDKDANWLSWFEQKFSNIAGTNRQIDFDEFKRAFNVSHSTFFAERFFHLFDIDNSGTISLRELMDGLTILTQGTRVEKLRFLFRVYDVDGNGLIDFEELRTVLKSCMDESALKLSDDNLDELTRALFEDADIDGNGSITFDELQAELEKHPDVIENLTISAANWLKPQVLKKKKRCLDYFPSWMRWTYIRNNLSLVFFVVLFASINVVLFIDAAVRHREKGFLVSIARGCGQCLNFTPVVVLILMMRKAMTWLRSTRLSNLFPLDHYIELHKMTGYVIFFFSMCHFLAHLANFSRIEIQNIETNYTMWMYLFGVGSDLGWVFGTAGLTGLILLIILIIMIICSLPVIRRKGKFEVFYWTHNLFIVWYIVLILHGPHFWKWFIGPALFYIFERILRSKIIKLVRYGRTYIQEGILLPSKVVHLVISRPTNFSFQPGDYVFVQIPCIAKYEWHPFTISSAPEQQGVFWLHIRSVGTWTKKLYEYFEMKNKEKIKGILPLQLLTQPQKHLNPSRKVAPMLDGSLEEEDTHPLAPATETTDFHRQSFSHMHFEPVIINVQVEDEDINAVQVFIDGPYGSPSVHIFQAEHAVLIGAGIGVTPFASILQSIMIRYRNARQVCPRCNHSWTGSIPSSVMRLRKVDFFWINRHQKYFEWFISLLSQLEIEQTEQDGFDRFLDMHMYMTSALRKTDMKGIGLQMALDLIHKKEKRDLITGLKTRTQAGRPNWEKVFQQLDNERRGKITVFYCGMPSLGRILREKCVQYGFEFRKENF